MPYDVFISHSSKDKNIADAVTAALEHAKIRCWIAPRDIRPGDSWGGAIVEAIELCKVMVVVFSAQSNSSKQVMREVERAVQHDIVVVPFRIEDVKPTKDMEYFLSSTHWLDAVSPELDAHLVELKTTVQSILDKPALADGTSNSVSYSQTRAAAPKPTTTSAAAPPTAQTSPNKATVATRVSKLPMMMAGLALVIVIGYVSFGFFAQDNSESNAEQQNRNNKPSRPKSLPHRSDGDVVLQSPNSVLAGDTLSISWQGEVAENDYIVVTASDAAEHVKSGRRKIGANGTIETTMGSQPGDYQIRFFDSTQNAIIARKDFTVTTPPITLNAPKSGLAGSSITIDWTGPNNRSDYLSIAKAEQKNREYANLSYISKGSPTQLRLPDLSGQYEIRYVAGDGRTVWHRQNITVEPVQASITQLEPQIAGAEVAVHWSGPANKGDYLSVSEPDAKANDYFSYRYLKAGETAKLRLPATAGTYQIRYISGQNKDVWAQSSVELKMPTINVDAPSQTVAGTLLQVAFEGPANRGDYLSIAKPSSNGKEYLSYRYVTANTDARIKVPQDPSNYVIRYVSGADNSVWWEAPLQVNARSESLNSPSTTVAGNTFDLSWQHPGQQGEYIGIYPNNAADDDQYLIYVYTNNKTKAKIKAPTEPGLYEIRYVSGNKKLVWGRQTITVTAP